MKKVKLLVTLFIFVLACNNSTIAQDKEEKFYYKDTIFEFYGFKIEVTRSVSDMKAFRSILVVTNTTDNFMLINPWEVFGCISNSSDKFNAVSKRTVVIAPKYSKRFTVKFVGRDFREPNLSIDFSKLNLTEKVESVYELPDMDISKENFRMVGPIKFTVIDKDLDKGKADFRIIANLEYTGTKFLGIFYNNIMLKTKDGSNFINTAKKTGDFHYDNQKPFKKINLNFPVETEKLKKAGEPKLSFSNVFKEYSLSTIEGFKINLRAGTLADYKGKSAANEEKEEEME